MSPSCWWHIYISSPDVSSESRPAYPTTHSISPLGCCISTLKPNTSETEVLDLSFTVPLPVFPNPVDPARNPKVVYSHHLYPINLQVLSFWPPKYSFNMPGLPISTAILPPLPSRLSHYHLVPATLQKHSVWSSWLYSYSSPILSPHFNQTELSKMKMLQLEILQCLPIGFRTLFTRHLPTSPDNLIPCYQSPCSLSTSLTLSVCTLHMLRFSRCRASAHVASSTWNNCSLSFTFLLPAAAQTTPTYTHMHNPKPQGPHPTVKPDQKELNDQQPMALKHITRTEKKKKRISVNPYITLYEAPFQVIYIY